MRGLFIILLSLLPIAIQAQTYQGRVTTTSGNPLPAVSVLLLSEKGSNVAFTKTDKNGHYTLTLPHGKTASKVTFVRIGYAKENMSVKELAEAQGNIRMTEKTQEIKEVEVRPEHFRIKGDTTSFSVMGYREKQDRSIEDVIARLPGVTVNTYGMIMYQGRPISKFYIDGKDMMGGNYAMASRNLSADKVDSVEVIKHHQPVKSLRGKTFSDQVAMNIVLKPGAKWRWTGTAEIGSGMTLQKPIEWTRRARLAEMFFGNKWQSLSMYKHNNTAEDIASEVKSLGGMSYGEESVLQNISTPGTGRTGFNNSHLAATNWYVGTGENGSLRLQASALFDKTTSNSFSETSYLDVIQGSAVRQERHSASHISEWKGELEYTYNGGKLFVSNIANGVLGFDRSESNTILNGRYLRERVKPHKQNFSDMLRINLPTSRKATAFIWSTVRYSHQPGRLLLYNQSEEELTIQSFSWENSFMGSYQLSKPLYIGIDISQTMERKKEHVVYNDTTGQANFHHDDMEMALSISYHQDGLNATINNRMKWVSREIQTDEDHRWIWLPNINLNWQFSMKWSLTASYLHSFSPGGFLTISPLRLYTSYNYASSGSGKLDETFADNGNLQINYSDLTKGWSASGSFRMARTKFSQIYESTLNDGVYIRKGTDEDNVSTNSALSFSINKSFRSWRARIGMNSSFNWNESELMFAGKKATSRTNRFTMELRASARPSKLFYFEEQSMFMQSEQKTFEGSKVMRSFSHTLKLFLQPDRWQMEWDNECRHSNDGSERFSFFSDISVSYKTQKYEITAKCSNILGKNKREFKFFFPTGSTYSVTEQRPREIIASIIFSL